MDDSVSDFISVLRSRILAGKKAIYSKKLGESVFGMKSFIANNSVNSIGHRQAQTFAQIRTYLHCPNFCDGFLQFGERCWIASSYFLFHDPPTMLYWVQIRGVSWPWTQYFKPRIA